MKNTIKTFALFLTAGAMLASCDSYLDRQPDEPLTSDNIFKKQKTTLQYLTNIYSYQPDYEAPACVSNSNDIPWEASSDETSFAYLDRSYTQINYNSWNPSLHIYRDDTYNTPYKGIREANYFMQNVHKCPPEELNDVDKGYYYNEARFLRAHFYAMMLPVYGPVFLIGDDPVDFTQSGLDQRERNTWDECVNYVANELWEAAKGLPDSWPDIYYGRATKGAALAARARLLLYSARKLFNGNELYKGIVNKNGDHLFPTQYDEKKWELAAQAAKDVMNLNQNRCGPHTNSHCQPFRLPQESEEHVDGAAGDIIKDPDEDADHDDAGDDDQRVVDGLLAGGPLDLLQLALHILQPLADAGEQTGLGLFVGLLVLLRLVGTGLGSLLQLFVLSHLRYPSFLTS